MKILQLASESDFREINQFFGDMWHEEFKLQRYDRINEYKNGIVLYIKKDNKIIGVIFSTVRNGKPYLGRFGVDKKFRGNGYGRLLMESLLELLTNNGNKELNVNAEISKIEMYKKFGFTLIGEPVIIGNTKSVYMRKIL